METLISQYKLTKGRCLRGAEPCKDLKCRHHLYATLKPWQIEAAAPCNVTCTIKLGSLGGMTLDEVGLYLGMTRERIRQIEGKALTKLSDALTRQGFSAELFLKDVAGN